MNSPMDSVVALVHRWMDAVNSGRLETVVGLYAEEAVLLPTFSPHALRTPAARLAYFTMLTTRPGLRVSLHENTVRVQSAGGKVEIASGIYRFHVEIDGEPLVFEARFSLIVDVTQSRPILHHHSSQLPRTLS
ncbi:MAG: DUF4440 domain-containing protein [Opitutaceae bacterium]|nr:DUF4440 domain-containing protein [Opitutaceae bacterium]